MSKLTPLYTRERIRSIVCDQLIKMNESGNPDAFFIAREEYHRRLELAGLPLDDFFSSDIEQMLDIHLDECSADFENATIKLQDSATNEDALSHSDKECIKELYDKLKDIQTSVDILIEQAFNEDAVTSLSLARVVNVAMMDLAADFEIVV